MRKNSTFQMGLVKCRNTALTVQTGTKQKKLKGHTEEIEEPIMTTFWSVTPIAYNIDKLRAKLTAVCKPLIAGKRKVVELSLERFPQVNTVMGEIVAQMSKGKRLVHKYTTDDEENTLFVITRA